MRLSPKQKRYWNEANCRWNVKYGATRSGKTYLDYFVIPRRLLAREGRPGLAVLLGNTRGTLERNVLAPMRELYGAQMVSPLRADGTATLFGQRVHCLGADNKRHVDRLRGASIKYCYGDEVVSWEREVFEMLKSRLDKEYSCFDGTCNPAGPGHWFYRTWILEAEKRNCLRLHFTMEDNPALSPRIRARYRSAYSGVFYRRFVLGEWTAAQGRVYDFFDRDRDSAPVPEGDFQEWRISVDYGTANPASFGLWGRQGEIWYRVGEFYYDSRREGRQKTDAEYVRDLRELAEGREITRVIVDPSAASFIEALRREGFRVVRADNDVADGIRVTADLLKRRRIVICGACADCLREMETYCWDDKGRRDAPKKEQDHAMDDLRYFAMDLAAEEQNGFAATWVERRA